MATFQGWSEKFCTGHHIKRSRLKHQRDRLELFLQSGQNERWLSGWHVRCISAIDQYIRDEERGEELEARVRVLVLVLSGLVEHCDKWHGELATELHSIASTRHDAVA